MDCDHIIVTIAARQHGVVTRRQLEHAGMSVHMIEYRVKRRRLARLHRGVYRLGPIHSPYERQMAAVLACGADAVVSHRSAAELWELVAPAGDAPVHVTVVRPQRAPASGVRLHRTADLTTGERTQLHGVPVTSAARTLLDFAGDADEQELERALAVADRQQLAGIQDVQHLLGRYPHRRGTANLRRLLARVQQPALTRSEAEARFLELIRKGELKRPGTNVTVRGCEVDFLWRSEHFAVEVDGFAFHSSAAAFERDRKRDAILTAAGLRVMRVTWRQIVEKPEVLLVRVAQALARSDVL